MKILQFLRKFSQKEDTIRECFLVTGFVMTGIGLWLVWPPLALVLNGYGLMRFSGLMPQKTSNGGR